METIGEKIRSIRKSKGISQETVSNTCGITQPSYANIESGKTQNITIEIGKGIAKALDVSFVELFEIESFISDSNDLKMHLDQLREKTNELEKQLVKELELNTLLKNENKRLYTEVFICTISSVFDFFNELYIFVQNSNNEEENEKRNSVLKSELKSLERYISETIEQGIISKSELLEIIYNNDWRILKMEDSSTNLSEDLKNHLKQYIEINDEDIERLLILHNSKMLRKKIFKRFE
jgi:transcriptional regulator with XRE-family HTH domain